MFRLCKYIPRFAVIFLLAMAAGVWSAHAGTLTDPPLPDFIREWPAHRIEISSGVQLSENAWASYASLVWAPRSDLDERGPRLRIFASWGEFSDRSDQVLGPVIRQTQLGRFEAMPGYQWRTGPLITGLYAGLAYENHAIAPPDPVNHNLGGHPPPPEPGNRNLEGRLPPPGPGNPNAERLRPPPGPRDRDAGAHWGAKAAIETWLDLSENAWFSVHASYSTANDGYGGFVRAGYRMLPWLSIGPEAAAFGDFKHDAMRAGGFAQFHVLSGDVTVSGGMSGDDRETSGAYGELSFHRKF